MTKEKLLITTLLFILLLVGCGKKSSSTVTTSLDDSKTNSTMSNEITKTEMPIESKCNVIFKNGDEILQEREYERGEIPSYDGAIPYKEDEGLMTYKFIGWDKAIIPAFKDMEYIAQFEGSEMMNEFVNLKDIYYPYSDSIKRYLTSNDRVELYTSTTKGYEAIRIEFGSSFKRAEGFKFYYGTNPDYLDEMEITIKSSDRYVELYNLLKDTEYYIRLTSVIEGNEIGEIKAKFKTSDLGPRPIKVDGIDNVRDLGGYETLESKTIQNMLFRGSEMNGPHNLSLTESGQKTMSEELGIKLDIDLRGESEAEYIKDSPIDSASYKIYPLTSYDDIFYNSNTKKMYKSIFQELANENNYPIYFHCWGGADRTGTLSFMINAFLGVSEKELINDYEYTTFSSFGLRSKTQGAAGQRFYEFLEAFNRLEGNTPKEKATGYLKSIGVSDLDLYNFDHIMHGKETMISISCDSEFSAIFSNEFVLSGNITEVKEVLMNGNSTPFTYDNGKITILSKDLLDLPSGLITGEVIFLNDKKANFSFENKRLDFVDIKELDDIKGYINVEERVTLNKPIGYGKFVKARIETDTTINGGVYMLIGSYGFLLRGGLFRFVNMTSSGVITDYREGPNGLHDMFNSPKDVYFKVNVSDTNVGFDLYVLNGITVEHFEYSYPNAKLHEGEIDSSNAKVTFDRNKADVSRLYIIPSNVGDLGSYKYVIGESELVSIPFNKPEDVVKVIIGDGEIPFSIKGYSVIIDANDLNLDKEGTLFGKIVTLNEEYPFEIECELPPIKYIDGVVKLNSDNKKWVGTAALGYGNEIKIHLKTATVLNGNLFIVIGSYGIQLRGGSFRTASRLDGTTISELKPRPEGSEYAEDSTYFDRGGYLSLKVSIKDDTTVTIEWSIYNENDELWRSFSIDRTRIENEIASDKAVVSIDINDATDTSMCEFYQA